MSVHKAESNARTTIIAQIEDAEALDNLKDIFSVEGIDCFFIGRSDLTISLGLDDPADDKVLNAIEEICQEAKKQGRTLGTFTTDLDEIPRLRELGVSMFLLESDHSLLLKGAGDLCERVKCHF